MSVTEEHPLRPFLPENTRLLMLGSFPPARNRWCMDFFYPNFFNDMWRIFGHIFFCDKLHFLDSDAKIFRREDIISFLNEKGIGLYDTACKVCRTKNTASDKDLEIVEATDLGSLLASIPTCRAVNHGTEGHRHICLLLRNKAAEGGRGRQLFCLRPQSDAIPHAEQFARISDED